MAALNPSGTYQAYSLGGVVDFLQELKANTERERDEWLREKAALQVCRLLESPSRHISGLQERVKELEKDKKFSESVQETLVRRVKMLEYALNQERLDRVHDREQFFSCLEI